MVRYDFGRKETDHITFKIASGESNSVTTEMVDGWWETSLQLFYHTASLKAFAMLTNLDCFMNDFLIKPMKSLKSALTER